MDLACTTEKTDFASFLRDSELGGRHLDSTLKHSRSMEVVTGTVSLLADTLGANYANS